VFVVDHADRLLVSSDAADWPLVADARAGQPGAAVASLRMRTL